MSDTGPGISKQDLPKIFSEYGQATHEDPEVQKHQQEGVGLGLVLAQMIVQSMGGNIVVSSNAEEGSAGAGAGADRGADTGRTSPTISHAGSVFSFSIPYKLYEQESDTSTSDASADGGNSVNTSSGSGGSNGSGNGSGNGNRAMRVLCVEDDHLNRMVLHAKLIACGDFVRFEMYIDFAETGEEALILAMNENKNVYDLIIMDEHLGGGGYLGSQTVTELRTRGCTSVVVSCSASCSEEDCQRYMRMGADATWPKPYPEINIMAQNLKSWFKRRGTLGPPSPTAQRIVAGIAGSPGAVGQLGHVTPTPSGRSQSTISSRNSGSEGEASGAGSSPTDSSGGADTTTTPSQ